MKRFCSLLLAIILVVTVLTALPLSASAQETDEAPSTSLTVPQIRVTTEDGNGTTLEKADGYVNASITITDTDGSVLSDSVQFKVRGNSTALTFVTKKAFTFKFGKKKNVLGMGSGKKWALLANAFDPTLMRNYLAFDLAHKMGLEFTSEQKYVELWVDGSFRGCYVLMEPVQEGKDRVNIDIESNGGMKDFLIEREYSRNEADVTYFKTDGIRFAVSEPEEPTADQLAYIQSTMDDIMTAIKSGDRDAIAEKIDVPSFTRFYLLNELYKTVDFDFSSVFFYYKDGVLYAGPAWDYDLAAGNENESYSATSKAAVDTKGLFAANRNLYRYLCSYDWFVDEIRATYSHYYNDFTALYEDGGLLDSLPETYGGVFRRNYNEAGWSASRWWVNVQRRPDSTFDANVAYLRAWLRDRNEWLIDYYGVTPEPDEPDEPELYILGDADGNGSVEILDATKIQRLLADLETDADGRIAIRGNVRGDDIDIMDATLIQRYLAAYTVSEPVGESFAYPAG